MVRLRQNKGTEELLQKHTRIRISLTFFAFFLAQYWTIYLKPKNEISWSADILLVGNEKHQRQPWLMFVQSRLSIRDIPPWHYVVP